MFREPLCPFSGVQVCTLLHKFSAFKVLAGVLGRREAGRVHCVEAVFRPMHNGARNMLSYWFIKKS